MKDSITNYDISIVQLKNQSYHYNFKFDSSFFELFDTSIIEDGSFEAHIALEKTETMLQLHFHIIGQAKLACDRSLEIFDYPIDLKEFVIFKFGEEEKQLSDEVEIITKQTLSINIAQYLFEFISLAIPMKRLHPKFEDEQNSDSEDSIVYSSSDNENSTENSTEEDTDPRWAALKKLKKP